MKRYQLVSGALAALSFFLLKPNTFTVPGVMLWLGGLSILGFVSLKGSVRWHITTLRKRHVHAEAVVLLSIFALALLFRTYRLDQLPATMNADVLNKIYEVRKILAGEYFIYSVSDAGRETLFLYLMAAISYVAPLKFLTFKTVTALIGALCVFPVYVLVRRLAGKQAGVVASVLLAVGKWHVSISRMGYRLILAPFWAGWFLYFLMKAYQHGRLSDYFLAGLTFGIGLWTYPNFQFLVPALVIILIYSYLHNRRKPNHLASGFSRESIATMLLSILITVLPMIRFAVSEPETFFARGLSRVTVEVPATYSGVLQALTENLGKTLLMFTVRGDPDPAVNTPGDPQLDTVTGILFLIGVGFSILYLKKSWYYSMILTCFVCTIMAAPLAIGFPQEVPNGRRTIISSLLAYSLAGIGFQYIRNIVRRFRLIRNYLIPGAVLLVAAGSNYTQYFIRYPESLPYHNFPIQQLMAHEIRMGGEASIYYIPPVGYYNDEQFMESEYKAAGYTFRKFSKNAMVRPDLRLGKSLVFFLFADNVDYGLAVARNFENLDRTIIEYRDPENRIGLLVLTIDSSKPVRSVGTLSLGSTGILRQKISRVLDVIYRQR